jgi:predicted transcriptional regulator
MPGNILLLSVKPKYATKIFDGQKTVELRRVRTRLNRGDLVLVYVSSPRKVLMGTFEVESIQEIEIKDLSKDLNKFWQEIKNHAGITSTEFERYYQGATVVVGIFLKNVKPFDVPIDLDQLRQKIPHLKAPQSYRYLNENEMNILNSIISEKQSG